MHSLHKSTSVFLKDIKKYQEKKELDQTTMNELVQVIFYHNKRYYEENNPIISDGEYDQLFSLLLYFEKQFPHLINPGSPSQKIGGLSNTNFTKAKHKYPLISLANSYNSDDLDERDKQIKTRAEKEGITGWNYIIEPKFDGSAVEIIYQKGQFTQAITRGDGNIGEDITSNIKMISNLPLYVETFNKFDEIRLRGEVLFPYHMFKKVNESILSQGGSPFSNPRNAAAGTLRQLDSNIVKQRGLIVYVYDILGHQEMLHKEETDEERLEWLNEIGLPVHPKYFLCQTIQEVKEVCTNEDIQETLEKDNVEMDGLVIKVNQIQYRDQLGSTQHHPRRAIAYKYPSKQIAAQINSISYQVGRTGVITPVAELNTVELGGVKISRATLHNFDFIQERDIRVGDRVWIQRSGEVIPYILGPIPERREGSEVKTEVIKTCPDCGSKVFKDENEVAIICPNDTCSSKITQQLIHACSKNALNIDGCGESIIETLVKKSYLHNIGDIFVLVHHSLELKSIQGMGDKKIQKIHKEIEKTKFKELRRRIHAFGIKFIGKKISQDLDKEYAKWKTNNEGKLWDFFADKEYLDDVFGLGKQTILSLQERSGKEKNIDLLKYLEQQQVNLNPSKQSEKKSTHLEGKKIVITGSFEGYSRNQLQDLINEHGGIPTNTVSKKIDYLLCGEKAGSKFNKAEELQIEIIKLPEFFKLIGKKMEINTSETNESPPEKEKQIEHQKNIQQKGLF